MYTASHSDSCSLRLRDTRRERAVHSFRTKSARMSPPLRQTQHQLQHHVCRQAAVSRRTTRLSPRVSQRQHDMYTEMFRVKHNQHRATTTSNVHCVYSYFYRCASDCLFLFQH
ncbi:hypothetical protein NP493_1435g01001 [Ridgeia piscesae]|uniref:Uncharacterized protein n=1 Tax=Ridgeia piscesae TaxID=27915 RepID=A0AAD9K3A2_RIDPI|nr:hypothetical protein NP493_1435g01001 [Ridgeia piscesae]